MKKRSLVIVIRRQNKPRLKNRKKELSIQSRYAVSRFSRIRK